MEKLHFVAVLLALLTVSSVSCSDEDELRDNNKSSMTARRKLYDDLKTRSNLEVKLIRTISGFDRPPKGLWGRDANALHPVLQRPKGLWGRVVNTLKREADQIRPPKGLWGRDPPRGMWGKDGNRLVRPLPEDMWGKLADEVNREVENNDGPHGLWGRSVYRSVGMSGRSMNERRPGLGLWGKSINERKGDIRNWGGAEINAGDNDMRPPKGLWGRDSYKRLSPPGLWGRDADDGILVSKETIKELLRKQGNK